MFFMNKNEEESVSELTKIFVMKPEHSRFWVGNPIFKKIFVF